MSTWLIPAIFGCMIGSVILTTVYFYLYKLEGEKFLGIWTLAWLVTALRFFFHYIVLITSPTLPITILRYLSIFLSSILLFWGTLSFTSKPLPRQLILLFSAGIIWVITTAIVQVDYFISVVPIYLFMATVHIWAGISIIKISETRIISKNVTGILFILWGILLGLYPFIYSVAWFAPWGFSMSAFFGLIIAIGILMIYFEINRYRLINTEKRGQLLAENIQDVIYSFRTHPSMHILYLSPSFEKMSGHTVQEVTSRPELFIDIIHPEDRELFIDILKNSNELPTVQTLRWQRKDKEYIWVEISVSSVTDVKHNTTVFEGMIRDISTRVATERAIQREKMLSERIMETSPIGITIINPAGEIIYANDNAERIFGLNKENITQREYNNPEWRITEFDGSPFPRSNLPFVQVMKSGKSVYQVRHAIERSDGTRVYLSINASPLFDENGQIENIITTVEDITTRYQTELDYFEREKQYRTLFEKMLNGFAFHEIIYNDDGKAIDYLFIDANPSFGKITGLEPSQIIGKTVLEILPNTEQYWINTYAEVAATGKPRHFQNYSSELNRYFEVVAYSPEKGKFATIISDVTDIKRAEQELQIALKDLRQRSKESSALLEATRSVLTNHRFLPAAKMIFDKCCETIGACSGYITLNGSKANQYEVYRPYHEILQASYLPHYLNNIHEQTCKDGQVIIDNHFSNYYSDSSDKQISEYPANVMLSPMIINRKVVGVMIFQDKENGFTENDKKMAEGFSEIAAIALVNSRNLESLEESEERFRSVAESANDAIISIDEQENITYWNLTAELVTGYLSGETLKKNIRMILPDFSHITQQLQFKVGTFIPNQTVESIAIARDGDEFPVEVSYSRWETKDGTFSSIILRNISERKHAEEALKTSELRYRTLFENAPIGIGLTTIDGTLREANNSWLQMFGYSLEEMKDSNIHNIYAYPEERAHIIDILKKTNSLDNYDIRLLRKNQEVFHANVTTKFVDLYDEKLIFTMLLDITTRKQAEEALMVSEERYRSLVESINEVIFTSNASGDILFISPRIEQILGYQPAELIGKNIVELAVPEDRHQLETFLQQALLQETTFSEFQMIASDSSNRNLSLSIRPQQKGSGKTEASGIMADVTETRKMEKALAISQKLANIGTLTAAVSHEIKSPLQVIVGSSESILRRLERNEMDIERFKQQLETINRNGWRIVAITGSLLNYARTSDGDIEEDDMNDIVNDTLLLIEHQLSTWSNIKVKTQLSAIPPRLLCNRNKITQVLINLLMNARDAMPEGGEIQISTLVSPEKKQVILQVQDTGAGIPEEIRAKIFEPFYTTKPKGEGSGLGLSIIRDIVKEHHADIELDSEISKGSVFTVIFPAMNGQNQPPD